MTAQKWLEGNDGKEVALTGKENYRVLAEIFHEELPQWECPEPKIMTLGEEERMLWSRMLLSCLVDADYTASAEEDGEIIPEPPNSMHCGMSCLKRAAGRGIMRRGFTP